MEEAKRCRRLHRHVDARRPQRLLTVVGTLENLSTPNGKNKDKPQRGEIALGARLVSLETDCESGKSPTGHLSLNTCTSLHRGIRNHSKSRTYGTNI